ncbi:MAG TPA: hexose kinase [Anaerolineales bacterium]|nr:hexose kinase [Anaerolineales bacterium]
MILCINANAALDNILFIDRFRSGETMRPIREAMGVGGKGLDSALVLRTLGAPVRAVSFAAGRNGQTLADLLRERDVPVEFIWVPGETRVANVIVETDFNHHSHITTSGYTVHAQDCETFKQVIAHLAQQASWAIIGGTLPGGAPVSLYREIISILHQLQVPVLIDCAGEPSLAALGARPEIVKMNQGEFSHTFQNRPLSMVGWLGAAREVMRRFNLHNFVLTCGRKGLLAMTPQAAYLASAPQQQEVNAAGSGDAVSSALTYRLSLGEPWEAALRWAVAAGAAAVLTEGTAECRLSDVERIYTATSVQMVEEIRRG